MKESFGDRGRREGEKEINFLRELNKNLQVHSMEVTRPEYLTRLKEAVGELNRVSQDLYSIHLDSEIMKSEIIKKVTAKAEEVKKLLEEPALIAEKSYPIEPKNLKKNPD